MKPVEYYDMMDPLMGLFDGDGALWQAAGSPFACSTSPAPDVETADDATLLSTAPDTSSPRNNPIRNSSVKNKVLSVACLPCRERHLKCDGLHPCSRCVASEDECLFPVSRRGRRSTRRRAEYGRIQSPQSPSSSLGTIGGTRDCRSSRDGAGGASAVETAASAETSDVGQPYTSVLTRDKLAMETDKLLNAFYFYAFSAHPFVLPRKNLLDIAEGATKPVILSMRWIGSLYIATPPATSADLYEEAHRLVYDEKTPRDGFLAQAMMLLVVGLDGRGDVQTALGMLTDLERLALDIKLHTQDFATHHGRGMPVLEESWRRTWWELYAIDGMIAGVRRVSNFSLFDVPADVSLPCEEDEYVQKAIPSPPPFRALESRVLSHESPPLSSFCYRILSVQNWGAMMRAPAHCDPEDPAIQRISNRLTSWALNVPESKRHALQKDGKTDEMMFQAYMVMHATTILLHQPFSHCAAKPVQTITACGPHVKTAAGSAPLGHHTVKMNAAACAITAMVSDGLQLISHTHFFTCVLTLSSIAHLSQWAALPTTSDDEDLRDGIRLNIGALKRRAAVWRAAQTACTQVTSVANEIHESRKHPHTMTPSSLEDTVSDSPVFIHGGSLYMRTATSET